MRIKDAGADDKPEFFAWPSVFRNFFKKNCTKKKWHAFRRTFSRVE